MVYDGGFDKDVSDMLNYERLHPFPMWGIAADQEDKIPKQWQQLTEKSPPEWQIISHPTNA